MTYFLKVWYNALYLLHKEINSHESRFNLFGLLTNSTLRICLVARGGLKLVTFRSQSRRFPSTPHMSTFIGSLNKKLKTVKLSINTLAV